MASRSGGKRVALRFVAECLVCTVAAALLGGIACSSERTVYIPGEQRGSSGGGNSSQVSGAVSAGAGNAGEGGAATSEGGTSGAGSASGAAGGDAGASAGSIGGETGGSSGSGGAELGGSGSAGGGQGGAAPPGDVHFKSAMELPRMGGEGGWLFVDVCERDGVLVGFNYDWYLGDDESGPRAFALTPICATAFVSTGGAPSIFSVDWRWLPSRGAPAPSDNEIGNRQCQHTNEVVVGFEGSASASVHHLTLKCAPITVSDSGSLALSIGEARAIEQAGAISGADVFAYQQCPEGQVARGVAVRAGSWIDAFSLVCGELAVATPMGEPCSDGSSCEFGVCAGTCQACDAPETGNCTCRAYGGHVYTFCTDALDAASAENVCASKGMHLVDINDAIENGWIANNARQFHSDPFWSSGTDRASEGTWTWGTRGLIAAALQDGLDRRFADYEPNNSGENEHCLEVSDFWNDNDCAVPRPFVCESAD